MIYSYDRSAAVMDSKLLKGVAEQLTAAKALVTYLENASKAKTETEFHKTLGYARSAAVGIGSRVERLMEEREQLHQWKNPLAR